MVRIRKEGLAENLDLRSLFEASMGPQTDPNSELGLRAEKRVLT